MRVTLDPTMGQAVDTDGLGRARITAVDGGAADPAVRRAATLAVGYASAARLAAAYRAAADRLTVWAEDGARTLLDRDLIASALLAPLTFARAEAAVLTATVGPHGTAAAAVAWEADALLVRAAVALLQEQDAAAGQLLAVRDYAIGYAVGDATGSLLSAALAPTLALALPLVVGGVAVASTVESRVPGLGGLGEGAVGEALDPALGGVGDLADAGLRDVDRWLVDHPGAVRTLAGGGGGVLDGLAHGLIGGLPLVLHPTTRSAARTLARLTGREGPPRVTPTVAAAYDAPRDLRTLMTGLRTTALAPPGTIALQELSGPDGGRRWVAYLPGTDRVGLRPGDDTARDVGADVHLVAGLDTTYGDGVREALRQAGVEPHEPVLLVGHSAGGMQALALLASPDGYDITHVVTAGSPTARLPVSGLPPGAHVLSLESAHDVVPLLDGPPAPPTSQHVIVRFEDPGGPDTILGRHDLGHYVHGAAAVDRSPDPAVDDELASLGPWLDGTPGATFGFVVSR